MKAKMKPVKGVVYPKKLPKRLHRFFISAYIEENFDTRAESHRRATELSQQGFEVRRWTRERAMTDDRLRNPKSKSGGRT